MNDLLTVRQKLAVALMNEIISIETAAFFIIEYKLFLTNEVSKN